MQNKKLSPDSFPTCLSLICWIRHGKPMLVQRDKCKKLVKWGKIQQIGLLTKERTKEIDNTTSPCS